jgi:hypothetical protein
MTLNWNEIKDRALTFSRDWAGTHSEDAEAKPFLVDFFNIFGISRRKVATFEHRVKKIDDSDGYIDLLWKGTLLIEMKSRGKNLDKAYEQAKEYLHGLKEHELPKYILVSDFEIFRLYDLEEIAEKTSQNSSPEGGGRVGVIEFKLTELVNNVNKFSFILGYPKKIYHEEDPANAKAAEMMGKLHDRLVEVGYSGHSLEVYLVRVLFCLFAEDTSIFQKQQVQDYIEQRTQEDGSDLAAKLQELFQVLNTPKEKRFKNMDEQLNDFPYTNGKLFEEILPIASFDKKMRQSLLECCYIDWSKISPAIFGSMFQSIMNPIERRNLGAHYTSEGNILKAIKPLFLDALWAEFHQIKGNKNKLSEFHKKLSKLKFLDPACGCGNFLIIAYRELRLLEMEVLEAIQKGQQVLDIRSLILVDVDQMYGIEYEEFPARIAEVAMYLVDHQMNMLIQKRFGKYFVRLPLNKAATIVHGNALHIDWQKLLNPANFAPKIDVYTKHANIYLVEEPQETYQTNKKQKSNNTTNNTNKALETVDNLNIQTETYEVHKYNSEQYASIKYDYIMGNPPFLGSRIMNATQKQDLLRVLGYSKDAGELDYVTAWYFKAAKYIQGTTIKVAFVSTNSITQGLQVGILWGQLQKNYNIKIHFAHRSFKWTNEGRGIAAVHCVIIGFANFDTEDKSIFDYEDIKGEAHELKVKNINPYLVDAKDILIAKRSTPICNVPKMNFGNMPADGGNFLFTTEEKDIFLNKEPNAGQYFKPFISAYEFLNNKKRWCLWLQDIEPQELRSLKYVKERTDKIKELRKISARPQLAEISYLFAQITQPKGLDYIVIPRVSSENRKYIPIGFVDKNCIAGDSCLIIPNGTLYHFGILTSLIHIAWVKSVCGRLKSDFRYSKDIVYNNFPFPENPDTKQVKAIEKAAQKVLNIRAEFPNSSLADLYDIGTMPQKLLKAHNELDKAVDLAYRPQPFTSEANRMVFLFELYEKYTAGLFVKEKVKKTKKKDA